MKKHPGVALRDCDHCRKWLYDEKDGTIHKRHGKDVPRGNVPTPCENSADGCPKGHYNNQKTLNLRNQMCYQYIKEGTAVGWQGVPHDSVTRRNKALIDDLETNADKAEHMKLVMRVGGLSAMMGGGNGR